MDTDVKGLWAFWKYDKFPYALGGEMLAMNDKGLVSVKGYEGFWFTPECITTIASGKALLRKMQELEQARREAIRKLEEEFDDKLNVFTHYKGF
jgi:hypothetical protein